MCKRKLERLHSLFPLFLLIIASLFVFSCASVPVSGSDYKVERTASKKNKISVPNPKLVATDTVVSDTVEESTKLTAIKPIQSEENTQKNYTYFSHINIEIMRDVENGSPSSLRKAASKLRKSEIEYDEAEKVLLAISSNIMQMVWTTERVEWETFPLSAETSYMGAINSAKKGIYDESTGNVDFLTIVLPSLVVLKTDDVSDFFEQSEKALLDGLELHGGSVLANYLLGELYRKNNQYEKALPRFQKAAQNAPECLQTGYAYANILYLLNKLSAARDQINLIQEKYPSDIGLLNLSAHVAYDTKNLAYAEECVARVLQQDPNNLKALMFRIKILVDKKDYIHAVSLLDVYSRQDSTSKTYLLMRAKIQNEWSKNTTAAILTIENALKSYPSDRDVLLFAAKLSGSVNSPIAGRTAEQFASVVLENEPDNEEALRYAIEGLIQKKDWEKAYVLSKSLVTKKTRDDGDFENIFNHVKICLGLSKGDEAWNYISPIYRNNSQNEDVIQSYITVMIETGRISQVMTLINQLLPNASSRLKSFLYYKRSFLQASEDNSLADLRSSLISNPRNSDSLFRLYQIYYNKKDYRKAQYYLKQVVALNPNDSSIKALNEELTRKINY